MRKNLILITFIASIGLTACSWLPDPHKIDIQQGNRIQQEDLDKIQTGMTQSQVKFVLGTPLLQDGFHQDRWDYVFYLKPGRGEIKQSHVRLIFEKGKLVKIDKSRYQPEQQELRGVNR